MVETKEEKGFAKDVEVVFKEVELKVNRNNEEQIDKVIFHRTEGNITWKPKIRKETFEGGFKVSKMVPLERGVLPDKLNQIAMTCSEKGQCKLKVSYHYWNTEADGQPVTYRYIQSIKTLDTWEIIKEEIKEERVSP